MIWDPFVEDADFPDCESIDNPSGIKCDMVVLATAHDDCISLDWVRILGKCRSGMYSTVGDMNRTDMKGSVGNIMESGCNYGPW